MSDFDPYLKWLGIRDSQRPPNHYRLLGLEMFEADAEVISGASDRQMAHVRTFQLGPHGELSQSIMGELAEARRCLLHPETKQQYDESLTRQIDSQALMPPTLPAVGAPPVSPPVAIPATAPQLQPPVAQPPQPNFTTTHFDNDGSVLNDGPKIRSGKPRKDRSKSKALIMLFSWVSGGLAALGVGYWLVNSGIIGNQSPVKDIPAAEKVEIPKTNNNAVTSNATKPNKTNGTNTKADQPKKTPSKNLVAPWNSPKRPAPPESLVNPTRDLDKLLQGTRLAIARRDYTSAIREWNSVRNAVHQINPQIREGQRLIELQEFWDAATTQARSLSIGDRFDFLGQSVQVTGRTKNSLTLVSPQDKFQKTFPIRRAIMDRDLASSLVKIDKKYNDQQVSRILAGDFQGQNLAVAATTNNAGPAPWDNPKWPLPPSSLSNPTTEIDRLVQATRIALSKRDFKKAQEEWEKVSAPAKQLDPNINLADEITNLTRVLTVAAMTAQSMQPGDKFKFLNDEVTFVKLNRYDLTLQANQAIKKFDVRPDRINRDLVRSLLLHNNRIESATIDRALANDFLHHDTTGTKLPSFFENPDTMPVTPPVNTGVVDVEGTTDDDPFAPKTGPTVAKSSVPDSKDLDEAVREVKSLYGEAFDKNQGYTKMIASVESMVIGARSTIDPALQYAMLTQASEIACTNGEAKIAFETLRLIGQHFDVDFWETAKKSVSDVTKKAKSFVQVNDLHDGLLDLTNMAIEQKQYEVAAIFASKATATAKKLDDEPTYEKTVSLRNDVREMVRMFDRAEKAKTTLAGNPDDAAANQSLGEFLCLVQNNYEEGLPLFIKSNDEDLKALALLVAEFKSKNSQGEVPSASHVAEQLAIADAWYLQGKDLKSFKDRQLMRRARHWYQLVASDGSGAEKTKADARLAETAALATGSVVSNEPFFDRRWEFNIEGDRFETRFFKSGRVEIQFGQAAQVFRWTLVDKKYQFLFPQDNSIFSFEPIEINNSLRFEKITIRNGRQRVIKRGIGTLLE